MRPVLVGLIIALLSSLALAGGSDCPRAAWTPLLAQARVAVLRNDAAALRNFFQIVASREDLPGLSAEVKGLSRDPRLRTAKANPADVVVAGAGALGEIGEACASCHRERKLNPADDELAVPEVYDGAVAHMARHQWAVDRMWEGLVGPTDARWALGVAALHDHPLDAAALSASEDSKSPADYLDWWIHKRGPDEALKAGPGQRGRIYGDLLGACAACHAGTPGGPGSTKVE